MGQDKNQLTMILMVMGNPDANGKLLGGYYY